MDANRLHEACLPERILVEPGTLFSASGRFRNCLRIGVVGDWLLEHLQALARVGDMACHLWAEPAAA